MTDYEQKLAAKRFAANWKGKGYEKGQSQAFWLSLLRDVFGIEHPEEFIIFEEQVHLDHTSFIDGTIPATKVLIEQKGLGKDLNKPIRQSDGSLLNPFQQAKRYITELPLSQHPRWVVTCNFAEDAGIFGGKSMFHDYLRDIPVSGIRRALVELFKTLDQKPELRDKYLADDNPVLAAFPYVNGGLFSDEDIEIPPFTEELKALLLKNASEDFNWSDISPTIFGAVFESTLNPETRRSGGMHYTSIENIHKVIAPLFLDGLKAELAQIIRLRLAGHANQNWKPFSGSWQD